MTFRVHVQLPYGLDATKTEQQFHQGLCPDRVAYGFHHAEGLCEGVTYSVDAPESWIQSLVRKILFKALGFDVMHAWRNRARIDRADIIWTMLECDYLAVLLIFALRPWVKTKPVIAQNVWLFNDIMKMGPIRRFLYMALAARATILTTHSRTYIEIMRTYLPKSDIRLMLFGISRDAFFGGTDRPRRNSDGPIRLFSAGNDRTRDWKTLLDAFGNDERFCLTIVCDWVGDEYLKKYRNLELIRRPSMARFRQLYRDADFVIVSMVDNAYSGITVALESVALGVPVVSSRTGGVPTYFDETEVLYASPANPHDLREKVVSCSSRERREIAERARLRFVACGYSTEEMIHRYIHLSREILDTQPRRG